MYFHEWKALYFDLNFTEVSWLKSNWEKVSTHRRQAITWTRAGPFNWRIFAALGEIIYRKTSNISRTLVDNKIVDNSDVVGASPVGAAPTTSSFST